MNKDLFLEVKNISKSYSNNSKVGELVIKDFSLDIKKGEIISLFGPNGCGKSTLINLISDIYKVDNGSLNWFKERDHINIGYVFQQFENSLFPWKKVIDNLSLKFEIDGLAKKKIYKIVDEFVKEINLNVPLKSYPYQLSGGQKQIIALLRTIIYKPEFYLLDEPLSALDFNKVFEVMLMLSKLWYKQDATVLFISHDIEQALFLSDKVLILTGKPMCIKKKIDIPYSKPRDKRILEDQLFFKLKTEALQAFYE